MKKTVSLILSLTFVLMALTACAPSPNPAAPDGQNQPTATPTAPAMQTQTQAPEAAGTENPTATQQQSKTQGTPAPSDLIGEEKAKEIALNRAGITAEGVVFDRVELDRDDGVWQYEVEFRQGLTEYDADIKADDGTILKWEMDTKD